MSALLKVEPLIPRLGLCMEQQVLCEHLSDEQILHSLPMDGVLGDQRRLTPPESSMQMNEDDDSEI